MRGVLPSGLERSKAPPPLAEVAWCRLVMRRRSRTPPRAKPHPPARDRPFAAHILRRRSEILLRLRSAILLQRWVSHQLTGSLDSGESDTEGDTESERKSAGCCRGGMSGGAERLGAVQGRDDLWAAPAGTNKRAARPHAPATTGGGGGAGTERGTTAARPVARIFWGGPARARATGPRPLGSVACAPVGLHVRSRRVPKVCTCPAAWTRPGRPQQPRQPGGTWTGEAVRNLAKRSAFVAFVFGDRPPGGVVFFSLTQLF
jgi:hypothetical protein